MLCVLGTGIREQQKYENRKQTSVVNTVNNLHHESFKIVLKKKYLSLLSKTFIYFFKTKIDIYLFLEKYFFKIPKNSFFAESDTKKRRYTSTKSLVFAYCRGKFRMLLLNLNLVKSCKQHLQTITKLLRAYSFRETFFIDQNVLHLHLPLF